MKALCSLSRRRPRVRFIPQLETSECGAACLAMVLDAHGADWSPSEVRERCGTGRENRLAIIVYSVLGVTKDDAWLPCRFGTGPRICFVLKSRRSMRASRPFISLTNSHRPSYSPFVSDSEG